MNINLQGWQCDSCEQKNTFNEIISGVIKVAAIGVLGYVAFNYRNDIKEAVNIAIAKAKSKNLNGTKRKK